MNKLKIKVFLIVSLLVIVLLVIAVHSNFIILNKGKIDNIYYTSTENIKINYRRIIGGMSSSDKSWRDLAICEKFSPASFNSAMYYNCKPTPLPVSLINDYLGEIAVRGQDYSDGILTNLEKQATIYSIKDIPSDSAIAIKFENTDEYYTYISSVCTPSTLGDLMSKYNFDKYLSCTSTNYKKEVFDKTIDMEISGVSNDYVESILFSNQNIATVGFDEKLQSPYFTFSSDSPVYGSTFYFHLFKNGDLIISIPPIRKSLRCNIGTDSTNMLLNYIYDNGVAHAKITSYRLLSYFFNLN